MEFNISWDSEEVSLSHLIKEKKVLKVDLENKVQ